MKKKTLLITIIIVAVAVVAAIFIGFKLGAFKKGAGDVIETYTNPVTEEPNTVPEETGEDITSETETQIETEDPGGSSISEGDIVVLSIGNRNITMDDVNYHLYALRDYYVTNYGENPWNNKMENGQTVAEYAKEQLKNDLIRTQILCDQAEQRGITLTEDEQEVISERAADYMSMIGMETAENFSITPEAVEKAYRDEELATRAYIKILNEITSEMNKDVTYRTYSDKEFEEALMKKYYDLYQSWLPEYEVTTSGIWERIVVGSVG